MSRTTGLALIAWLLLLGACSSGDEGAEQTESDKQRSAESKAGDDEDDEDESPPIPVEVALPDRGDVYAVFSGTAPIEAFAEADVVAKVAGEVREILAEEGQAVEQGEVLAKLDGDRLALELSESRARLQKLKNDFQRNINLRDKGLISEGDFDKLKYELEALEASYNLARLELDYTMIRAPIKGVVSQRFIRIGNTVDVGDALFRVTSLDPLVAYLYVPEREYRRIQPGKPVAIQFDALGDAPILASVTRMSPVVDPETGTFKLTIEISDQSGRIKPGMFARIGVVVDQRENALRIPRSALLEDDSVTSVYVVADGVAERRNVETGYSDRGLVEIVSGLADDERVVTVGQLGLSDGANVSVIGEQTEDVADNADNKPAGRESDAGDTES